MLPPQSAFETCFYCAASFYLYKWLIAIYSLLYKHYSEHAEFLNVINCFGKLLSTFCERGNNKQGTIGYSFPQGQIVNSQSSTIHLDI